jgi:AcrR family transcriptional regulator
MVLTLANAFVTIVFVPARSAAPVSRRDHPAKPPLTREGIIEVALRLLRAEGLDRVTMRRLARELDTGPASLYVYVDNMADLHGAVLDRLLAGIDLRPAAPAGGWRARLGGLLIAYTELLFAYPSLARSVLTLRPSGPNYLRLVDSVLALLRTGGVSAGQAAWGMNLLLQLAVAAAAEHGTRRASAAATPAEQAAAPPWREASAGEHPAIAWASAELFTGTGQERLRWAFDTLIAGIAASDSPPRTPPWGTDPGNDGSALS